MGFDQTGLSEPLLRAVAQAGYTTPTPIQEKAIPLILQGRDLTGIAQTGTGKTASFALPIIDLLARGRTRANLPGALIVEPTRELALQVAENFKIYGANHNLKTALLIGGVSFDEQKKETAGHIDIIIATPGRLIDHTQRGRLVLFGVQMLVIDEADRMLDMGFIPDIEKIVTMTPARERQTLLFSATMPKEIQTLANKFLKNPERVEAARPATTAENVQQRLVWTKNAAKSRWLAKILRRAPDGPSLVFCNRKIDVNKVCTELQRTGFNAGKLHGDMEQVRRMRMLGNFRDGKVKVLVASNVAARGLDIPRVAQVINFDVPSYAEDYVHRIGRTGRAGAAGEAWTLAVPDEEPAMLAIEELTREPVPLADESNPRPVAGEETAPAPARRANGHGKKRNNRRNEHPKEVRGESRRWRKNGNGKTSNKTGNKTDRKTGGRQPLGSNGPVPGFLQPSAPKAR